MLDKLQLHTTVLLVTPIDLDASRKTQNTNMSPSSSPPPPPSPSPNSTTEIDTKNITDEQINHSNIKNNRYNDSNNCKRNKSPAKNAKTILNWLKKCAQNSNSKHNNNGNSSISNKDNAEIATAAAVKRKTCAEPICVCQNNNLLTKTRPSSAAIADGALRDFRGVQTLRTLWNKRISAEEEAAHKRNAHLKHTLNKSLNCLVSDDSLLVKNARATQQNSIAVETRAKRALSLHDCTQLEQLMQQCAEPDIDCVHKTKDNFYKYKNAEQAAQHLARDKTARNIRRPQHLGNMMLEEPHFPAVKGSARAERIHWLKREDILGATPKRSIDSNATPTEVVLPSTSSASQTSLPFVVGNLSANNCEGIINKSDDVINSTNRRHTLNKCMGAESVDSAESSPIRSGSKVSMREYLNACGKVQQVTSATSSKLSSSESLASAARAQGHRVSKSGRATRRKYSFKTHAGQAYHHHHHHHHYHHHHHTNTLRKMSTHRDAAASTTAANCTNGCSMVAKLTQQFNDIIQRDKSLLDEVKRKNGVWLSRGAYVYKVVETNENAAISRNNSDAAHKHASLVKNTIIKFEQGLIRTDQTDEEEQQTKETEAAKLKEKPAVPTKSAQLLVKTQARPNFLPLRNKQQHASGAEQILEVVREEAKTPLETTETQTAIKSEGDVAADAADAADARQEAKIAETVNTVSLNTLHGSEDDNADDAAAAAADEKYKLRKEKYAKIYQKFRFRSPFKKNTSKRETDSLEKTTPRTVQSVDGEVKIRDALAAVEQKIHDLSGEPMLLKANDDFEQRILPNSSFLHQTAQVSNNEILITQAVNVTLVNALEGEQMVMEQQELHAKQSNEERVAHEASGLNETAPPQEEDPLYEPIGKQYEEEIAVEGVEAGTGPKKTEPQNSFIFCNVTKNSKTAQEGIYQTVEEAHVADVQTTATAWSEGYETIADQATTAYDDYESFEPIAEEENKLKNTPATTPTTVGRNINDELPELPKPKRRLPKSPMPGRKLSKSINATSQRTLVTVSQAAAALVNEKVKHNDSLGNEVAPLEDHHYYADDDDENIYDTIKGPVSSHCYESVQKSSSTSSSSTARNGIDSISLTSNCYESITHYRHVNAPMQHVGVVHSGSSSGGSTLTISSDQKTNSLYEMSVAAAAANMLCGTNSLSYQQGVIAAAPLHSTLVTQTNGVGGSSDNSDDWVDISDAEVEQVKQQQLQPQHQQFIVVRERNKVHRSPDWSRRMRDKKLQQKKAFSSYVDDDSDHYYESLSPDLCNKRNICHVQRTLSHHKCNQDLPRYIQKSVLPQHSDDYDSFDSDTDEHEENVHNHNDSGVDIRTHRLPDPPQSTNQVYAIVRKLRNFISNKKSPSSSQQKLYENTSQFYVDSKTIHGNGMGSTLTKLKTKGNKYTKNPTRSTSKERQSAYENTEFHTPPAVLNTSELNFGVLDKSIGGNKAININTDTSQKLTNTKTKASKSLRSRLRESLGGSSAFDAKHLSALNLTRSTFYIEDPTYLTAGELDSGFSEKASSGDIPITSPTTSSASVPSTEMQKFSTVARKAKKAKEAQNAHRRRTIIGIRPHDPPPPPPPTSTTCEKGKHAATTTTTTSWYAECGVFKQNNSSIGVGGGSSSGQEESSLLGLSSNKNNSNTQNLVGCSNSWYTEAGLYQTSDASVASSSGSSGVSTGNEAGLGDELSHSMFLNEPLYQIYSAAKLESITRDLENHDEEGSIDGYEEVGQHERVEQAAVPKIMRPSALQLVEPTNGPSRTLWSQIPEVVNSCILPTLTPRERGLQEAKFEIITSEASYLKSLNLLRNHFMNYAAFRDTHILSARDRKALFSYIVPVHEVSERLLTELESCWQDNIMLLGLSKRIYAVAEKHFHVYIAFCEHQGRMDRTLRRLKEAKGAFQQQLEKLEASPLCFSLNLHSFLMLPMQRITRLPLLIDAVFSKLAPTDDEYDNWKMTLAIMNKIVMQCNEAANRCEQAYEIEKIARQLEFPTTIRALAIVPVGIAAPGAKPRYLVKKGELTHLIWRGEDVKLTFCKRFTKSTIYAFLFSDLLVLTKRRAEEHFTVFDYCPRSMLTIASGDTLPQLPTKDINQTGKNLILMTLLENHERKTVELVLSCPSVSEQERWLQAMRPPEAETPGEKLYETWDCPQVIAKHNYESDEPDGLNLELGDVINVTRKLPDGWYQGERIRDGAAGWFPGSYTEEVNSAHVRARNLKQRYRLLTFTATYLESQKRK